jgi:hypothetical protein
MSAMTQPATAFIGHRLLAAGPLVEVALAIKNLPAMTSETVLAFDDASGRVIDFDLRGSKAEVIERLLQAPPAIVQHTRAAVPDAAPPNPEESAKGPEEPAKGGRGRPKLGVVAREVTLLPRHWEWLAAQPGGASVTLRKLIEEARRSGGAQQQARLAQEAAYRFMSALAGDLPGFEEVTRALFADDRGRFVEHAAQWPADVRAYAARLAFGDAA